MRTYLRAQITFGDEQVDLMHHALSQRINYFKSSQYLLYYNSTKRLLYFLEIIIFFVHCYYILSGSTQVSIHTIHTSYHSFIVQQDKPMDVKRVSKNIVSKIQQNLRPISNQILTGPKSKVESASKINTDIPASLKKIDIEYCYKTLRQNVNMENKTSINIITCLKSGQSCWEAYLANPNKNGQLACVHEIKLKRIEFKLQQQISKLIVYGEMQKVKQASAIFKPVIDYLQKKSRKFKEHETEFKVISRKMEEEAQENEEKDDQIKQQMIDLVEKFKKYAININENLNSDTTVIQKISDSQDKHLGSLQSKNNSMEAIIKEQKLGFFQLIGMGVFAIVIWIIGLMFILIV